MMKHQFAILLFALFFTLTSANRINDTIQMPKTTTPSKQIFAPPVKTNNAVIKSVSENIGIKNEFEAVYDSLPSELKPNN